MSKMLWRIGDRSPYGISAEEDITSMVKKCLNGDALASQLDKNLVIYRGFPTRPMIIPAMLKAVQTNKPMKVGSVVEGVTCFPIMAEIDGLSVTADGLFLGVADLLGNYCFANHEFTIKTDDIDGDIVGFGVSPYVDKDFDSEWTYSKVKELMHWVNPKLPDLYDLMVLAPPLSLYYPDQTATVLFLKKQGEN